MESSNYVKWLRRNNNLICDICGRKRKRSEVAPAYGSGDLPVVMSCLDGCADIRHPLNQPPPVVYDGYPVDDARPEGTDIYDTQVGSVYRIGHLSIGLIGTINNPNNSFNMNGFFLVGAFPGNMTYINL